MCLEIDAYFQCFIPVDSDVFFFTEVASSGLLFSLEQVHLCKKVAVTDAL